MTRIEASRKHLAECNGTMCGEPCHNQRGHYIGHRSVPCLLCEWAHATLSSKSSQSSRSSTNHNNGDDTL